MVNDAPRIWDFAVAPPHSAPGVTSMVGYRGLDVPETVHRGMPSSALTFIVSLDDGVQAADTADALPVARPNPVILGGLHVRAGHVRQRGGQAGVQLAVHPLASRALFGLPAAELSDLAGIAADTGYCDQAHLTREFVRFAGVPPRAWLAEEFHSIHEGAYAHSVLAGQSK